MKVTVKSDQNFGCQPESTTELLKLHEEVAKVARRIMADKNADYGDTAGGDPFANFRADGLYGIVVRMNDKVSRLRTFAKRGNLSVADESAVDSAIDLLNYAVLAIGYMLPTEFITHELPQEAGNSGAAGGRDSKRHHAVSEDRDGGEPIRDISR